MKKPKKYLGFISIEACIVFLIGFLLPLMFMYGWLYYPEHFEFMGLIEWLGVAFVPIITYFCARLIDSESEDEI
ncbi:MAG: hypothetical protein HOH98_00265 [Flavobacteriaceae bacterium]|nr:hypothetical protein [Pelagibacterales bacterium]MBT6169162.1 hypothetical protein [Flavobacteriaceae bacterium]MBT7623428.1 hypothetical protein [Flavobacteriaceae bacterium]MDG1831046.1 hypothetical protein [Flavobacteriaceae bacterium]